MVGTLVVVTLVFAWAGEDGAVFAADVETATTGGAVLSDMVELALGTLLGLVEFDGPASTVVVLVVVGEDDEVGFGKAAEGLVAVAETFWVAAGVDVTVGGVEVATDGADVEDDRVEACGKSFTAVVLVWTIFTVVVTAGVTFTVFDVTLGAVVTAVTDVVVTDAGTALTAMGGDDTVDGVVAAGVITVVVLAESGPVVFTVVETEGFGSTLALEAVCVGFTSA